METGHYVLIGRVCGDRALCDDRTLVGIGHYVMIGRLCSDRTLCDNRTLVGRQDTM